MNDKDFDEIDLKSEIINQEEYINKPESYKDEKNEEK